jgi:hypothetical protein
VFRCLMSHSLFHHFWTDSRGLPIGNTIVEPGSVRYSYLSNSGGSARPLWCPVGQHGLDVAINAAHLAAWSTAAQCGCPPFNETMLHRTSVSLSSFVLVKPCAPKLA